MNRPYDMEFVLEAPDDSASSRKQGPRSSSAFRKAKLDVKQPELVPFQSILDFLEPGDPTFWLLDLQGELLLSLFPETTRYGGYEYDPRMLFTLWLFGLWCGASSSRQLETMTRRDVRFIALSGGLHPDHATLCRFRRSLGDSMDGLLKHSVDLAAKAGMVGFRRGHAGGHRLPGNVSQWRKLREQAEAEDSKDEKSDDSIGRGKDPDARTIKTKKGFVKGFNALALADEESGIVLSARVSNSSSDSAQLEPVLERCIEIHGELPDSIAADKGFDTPRNAYAMELLGVESFIPAHVPSVFTLGREGRLVCPAGHEPNRLEVSTVKGVPVLKRLVTICKGCPHWESCLRNGEDEKKAGKASKPRKEPANPPRYSRSVRTPLDVPVEPWLAMHARAKSEDGKQARKKRSCTVERVFAHTKSRLEFTRFSLRGLALVDLEWTLEMVAHNLWRVRNAASNALFAWLRRFLGPCFDEDRRRQALSPCLARRSAQPVLAA